mgnify:CR=1 FL=1
MKIQFVSDLHLELADNSRYLQQHPLPVTGDVLLLAGDTIYLEQEHLMKHPFWQWASEHYERVIAVSGNHEYYAFYDLATVNPSRRWELFPNVHIYSNTVEHLWSDIDIICSTLWAHIDLPNAYYTEQYVSDFHRIVYNNHRLTATDFNREHDRCVAFIKESVAASHAKIKLVLTHHVPSPLVMSDEFAGSRINGAFVADLTEFIKHSDIDFWIFGHSHRTLCDLIGHTQVLSNQLGYVACDEHLLGFDAGRYIHV